MRRTTVGAALLAGSSVLYVAAESVAAAAWRDPEYRYWHNNISDLGSPTCPQLYHDRPICSPHHAVMNLGFIGLGILFVLGIFLVGPTLNRNGVAERTVAALGWTHGVGVILVGIFPASDANLHGAGIVGHTVGAAATIVTGNVLAIVLPRCSARYGVVSWFPPVTLGLGLTGLAAFLILVAGSPLSDWIDYRSGFFERISVYTTIALPLLLAYASQRQRFTPAACRRERTG